MEVITKHEFFINVLLKGLGLKKYADMPSETQKLETLLLQIGALGTYLDSG